MLFFLSYAVQNPGGFIHPSFICLWLPVCKNKNSLWKSGAIRTVCIMFTGYAPGSFCSISTVWIRSLRLCLRLSSYFMKLRIFSKQLYSKMWYQWSYLQLTGCRLHDVILTVTGNLLIFTGDMRQNKKKMRKRPDYHPAVCSSLRLLFFLGIIRRSRFLSCCVSDTRYFPGLSRY